MMNDAVQNDILAIDVDAEIRKLGGLRLRSPAEQVVELVRFACFLGASRLDIDLKRRGFLLVATGTTLDPAIVERLVTAADSRLSQQQRHEAVVELEQKGALGLLAAFAPGTAGVKIEWTGDQEGHLLELRTGRPPIASKASGPNRLRLDVRGPRLASPEHRAAVIRSCRFSSIPIFVNGERVSQGIHLEGCAFAQETYIGSSRAVVGLPWRGELCRIIRLTHGILAEEWFRTCQRGLLFHAVIDEAKGSKNVVDDLRRRARQLYLETTDAFESLGEEARRRVFQLLLERSEKSGMEILIEDIPGFVRLGGGPLTLRAIAKLATRGGIYALGRGDDPKKFSSVGRVVLIVDEKQRLFLERHLDTTLPAPPPHTGRLAVPWKLSSRMSALLLRLDPRASKAPPEAVSHERLSLSEKTFCERVAPLLGSLASYASAPTASLIRFVEVSGPAVRRMQTEDGLTWFLARRHRIIGSLVRGVAADRNLAYPALAAMESLVRDGHEEVYDLLDIISLGEVLPSSP
jgi:hypothetical protein